MTLITWEALHTLNEDRKAKGLLCVNGETINQYRIEGYAPPQVAVACGLLTLEQAMGKE